MIVCPVCQTVNEDDARYCGRCGTTLHGVTPGPPPPTPVAAPTTPAVASEPEATPAPDEATPAPQPEPASESTPEPIAPAKGTDDSDGDWIALVGGVRDEGVRDDGARGKDAREPSAPKPVGSAAASASISTSAVPTPTPAPVAPTVVTPSAPPPSYTPPAVSPAPTPISPMQEAAPMAAAVAGGAAASRFGQSSSCAASPSAAPSYGAPDTNGGPSFDRSKLVPPSSPPPGDYAAPSYDDAAGPVRRPRSLWPLLVLAVIVVAIGGAWLGRSLFGGYERPVVASSGDDAAAATSTAGDTDTRTDWQRAYTDNFVSMIPASMVVSSKANVRNYPSTEDTQTTAELTEGTMVSGRWVRGKDPTTRWLMLDSGGYIWDGNLAQQNGPGSPIDIPLSNANSSFGRDIRGYVDQASNAAQSNRKPGAVIDSGEGESSYARVPNRRFHGLTITGVGSHYEGTSIVFRESPAAVRRAFRDAGVRIGDDGTIPMSEDAPESCSISTASVQALQYGSTELTCGL